MAVVEGYPRLAAGKRRWFPQGCRTVGQGPPMLTIHVSSALPDELRRGRGMLVGVTTTVVSAVVASVFCRPTMSDSCKIVAGDILLFAAATLSFLPSFRPSFLLRIFLSVPISKKKTKKKTKVFLPSSNPNR